MTTNTNATQVRQTISYQRGSPVDVQGSANERSALECSSVAA